MNYALFRSCFHGLAGSAIVLAFTSPGVLAQPQSTPTNASSRPAAEAPAGYRLVNTTAHGGAASFTIGARGRNYKGFMLSRLNPGGAKIVLAYAEANGTRTVVDTQTGVKESVDLGNVNEYVDHLNEFEPGRFRQIPLRDESRAGSE